MNSNFQMNPLNVSPVTADLVCPGLVSHLSWVWWMQGLFTDDIWILKHKKHLPKVKVKRDKDFYTFHRNKKTEKEEMKIRNLRLCDGLVAYPPLPPPLPPPVSPASPLYLLQPFLLHFPQL